MINYETVVANFPVIPCLDSTVKIQFYRQTVFALHRVMVAESKGTDENGPMRIPQNIKIIRYGHNLT